MYGQRNDYCARTASEATKDRPAPIIRRARQEFLSEKLTWTGPKLPRLWDQALDILEEYRGQLSLHDCLIVLIAREEAIPWVAGFDRGFDQVERPKETLEVLSDPDLMQQIHASQIFYRTTKKGLAFEDVFGEPLSVQKKRRRARNLSVLISRHT